MSTRYLLLALGCLSLLLGGGGRGLARAGCLEEGPGAVGVLNLETAWAIGGQSFSDRDLPAGFLGSWLAIHAVLSESDGCLAGESPPSVEQTLVLDGMTVADFGLWQDPDTRDWGHVIRFDGGRIRVFRDASPDADYLDDTTFTDGDLVLTGQVLTFLVTPGVPGGLAVTIQMEEHPPLPLSSGRQFQAGTSCDFECQPPSLTAPMAERGYFAEVSGSIVLRVAVGVAPTTWSSLKRGASSEQE